MSSPSRTATPARTSPSPSARSRRGCATSGTPPPPLPQVTAAMAEASVRGARGNSGMLLSQFLLGLREGLGDRLTAGTRDVAQAIQLGADRLQESLDEPVEGTILTVAREAADEAALARDQPDFTVFLRRLVERAQQALQRTPDLLPVLKAAGVVDAGAEGFVRFLDGIKRLIEEGPVAQGAVDRLVPNAAAQADVAPARDYQFCTEVTVRSPGLPSSLEVRQALRRLGGSIVVLQTGDLLKAHIHTDTPDAVFALGAGWGTVEYTKAEDVRAQRRALRARRSIVFVTDTACDLPDWLELTAAEFFVRLRSGCDATTSQPTPQAFEDAFRDAVRAGDHVIAIVLSRLLSGTYASAEAAARRVDPEGRCITVLDSRSASLGEGLLVLRGLELAAQDWSPVAVVRELVRVRDQSGGLFTVDNFERLVRSGRVGRVRAWLGTKLNAKPIMGFALDGAVEPLGRARGRVAVRRRVLELLDRALAGAPRALRLGVAHADIPEFARDLAAELAGRYRPTQCIVSPITPVIAAHAGIGAWGVFHQIEDGTNR